MDPNVETITYLQKLKQNTMELFTEFGEIFAQIDSRGKNAGNFISNMWLAGEVFEKNRLNDSEKHNTIIMPAYMFACYR